MKDTKENKKEYAIEVNDIDKSFNIDTQGIDNLKGFFTNPTAIIKHNHKVHHALSDISFKVEKGDFLGIIGRNGSGKSTLLKILAGIYRPDKGDVQINGKIVPFLELGVGFNPELNARENVFLNGTILGMSRSFLEQKYYDIVSFAEVEGFMEMKLKNFSSGMQLRLAFSIAILADADIYIMDEVLAVGDANFQTRCFDIFNKYIRKGKTIILVTHDTATVQRYCDKAILLRNGRVMKQGNAISVVDEYTNENITDEKARENKADMDLSKELESDYIKEVSLYNLDNNKQKVFKSGEGFQIRVILNRDLPKEIFNFGIALMRDDDIYIFGTNTFIDNTNLKKPVKEFGIKYPEVNLKSGTYYIKIGLWGEKIDQMNYFLDRSDTFKIVSSELTEGLVNISYEWIT